MSNWKKDLFRWPRSQSANPKSIKTIEPLVTIGTVDETADTVAKDLHSAAVHNRRADIIRHLESGICIDFPNDAGQTPLFCAAMRGHTRAVDILLQNGANPNEKDNSGMTPVHAACLRGNLQMLGAMIEYGGDLRLHDNKGCSCLDWAKRQPVPRKRLKMLEFLQKSQLFALNYTGDLGKPGQTLERQPSILQMLRSKVGSHMSLDFAQETGLRRVRSHGFGKVYYGCDSDGGVLSVIPLITENLLQPDDNGQSFDSTSGLVMESMRWDMTLVTVKQSSQTMHRENTVDLLITEVDRLAKLRHPNLLLLMGLCQSTNLDNLMLVFEHVDIGSLHHVMYHRMERLPIMTIVDLSRQLCDAMVYIHHQDFLHCGLSSHAVYMVSVHQAKLGSFEYMVERKKAEVGRSSIVSFEQHKEQLYRWMAPEVLFGQPPTVASDIYSYCCIMWEMILSQLPWKTKQMDEVIKLLKMRKSQLPTTHRKIPVLYRGILEKGLKIRAPERPFGFDQLQQWLQGPLVKPPGWKPETLEQLLVVKRAVTNLGLFKGISARSSRSSKFSPTLVSRQPLQAPSRPATDDSPVDVRAASRMSDSTNNHYQGSKYRLDSLHGSWSSLEDSESDEFDAQSLVSVSMTNELTEGEQQCYWRGTGSQHRPSRNRQSRRQDPVSQFEMSGLFLSASQLTKQTRRSANLPWQGSLGLLKAGSSSPRLHRMANPPQQQLAYSDITSQEGDCRGIPPVKPASHSTDVKSFTRSDSNRHSGVLSLPPHGSKSKSFDRHFSTSRHSPRSSRRTISRQCSVHEEGDKLDAMDLELKHQGSVRSLAEQFQTHVLNHSLRQSILRGSMIPQGACQEEPGRFKETTEENPNGKTSEDEIIDREESVCSLTTVSARDSASDDDTQGEEEEEGTELKLIASQSRSTSNDAVLVSISEKNASKVQPLPKSSTSDGTFQTADTYNSWTDGGLTQTDITHRKENVWGGGVDARKVASDRKVHHLSHCQVTDDKSPGKIRKLPSAIQTRRNLSPRESKDCHSPPKSVDKQTSLGVTTNVSPKQSRHDLTAALQKTKSGRLSQESRSGPSPHFDFQEYYIDDDYTALSERDQDRFEPSLCSQTSSIETHETHRACRGDNSRFKDQDVQASSEATFSRVGRMTDEKSSSHNSPEPHDTDHMMLQSCSDTADDSQGTSSIAPRCIVLNLERSGHDFEYCQQQSLDSQDDLSKSADDERLESQDEDPDAGHTPPCQTTMHKFYLQPNTCPGGYTTTLRVETSLQTPGSHHITHTARDQDTGITHTVHEETVTATTLRTTLGIQ